MSEISVFFPKSAYLFQVFGYLAVIGFLQKNQLPSNDRGIDARLRQCLLGASVIIVNGFYDDRPPSSM